MLEKETLVAPESVKERIYALESILATKEKEIRTALDSYQALKIKKEEIAKTEEKELLLREEITLLEKENLVTPENVKEKLLSLDPLLILHEKELRVVLNNYQELKTKKEHTLFIKRKIESLNTCPTCFQQVLPDYKQKIFDTSIAESETFAQAMQDAQLKQEKLEWEIQSLRKELELLRKQESESALIQLKIQTLQGKKVDLETLVQDNEILKLSVQAMEDTQVKQHSLETEIQALRKELELLRKQESESALIQLKKQNIDKKRLELDILIQRNEELSTAIAKLSVRIIELQEMQKSLSSLEELYLPLKQELDNLHIKLQQTNLEKMKWETTLTHLIENRVNLTQEIQKKIEIREKKDQLNSIQFWLTDNFMPLMDTMEKNILFKVHEEFNTLFEKWFAILIDNQSLVMSLDEEYSPKIIQNGYDIEYEFLSGGEKTAAALAYRLALNQVINRLNVEIKTQDLLILDEPTDGFSSEQLDRLKVLMDEIQIPQIILVSHEVQIECFADHIIRFEKRDHITKVIS